VPSDMKRRKRYPEPDAIRNPDIRYARKNWGVSASAKSGVQADDGSPLKRKSGTPSFNKLVPS
jgi:hypothetical protein